MFAGIYSLAWLLLGLIGFGNRDLLGRLTLKSLNIGSEETPFLLGFTGFNRVLLGFTGFYWVLLGFTGFYWVLLGFHDVPGLDEVLS